MWSIIALFAYSAFSCDEFCEEPNRTAIVVNFYSLETEEPASVAVKVTGIDGVVADSVLYEYAGHATVLLPINPGADEMQFIFALAEMPADTVIFRYSRHVGLVSKECGCASYAQLHEPELKKNEEIENSITKIEVTNPNVGTVSYRQGILNEENIRIFY